MEWLVSAAGAGLVMIALRDIFHTLWHPVGHGSLSRLVMRGAWRMFQRSIRRGRRTAAALAGPLAMVTVVCMWISMAVLGWTLIYWPHIPEAFIFAPGMQPDRRTDLLDALYLSLVNVATLGFGDIVPGAGWLRVAAPVQAMIGFALLTATVSWVLQIYPALTRRRCLAIELAVLRRSHATSRLVQPEFSFGASLLYDVATKVVQTRVDLVQYAESYYFHEGDDDASLAAMIGYAVDLAECGQASSRDDVRLSATTLVHALDDLAVILDQRFLHVGGTTLEIFDAYAGDHGRALVKG
ncbi:two pore domain potassium channel family protein [Nonomuraea turkmeniaca]|uniref:Two pore domain potassium channel family protein n=1 Tax=Nonomuraea turkmeniaca TaxID=103838 RepID=A0A5S4FC18_9ACTN|nr:potassium channel family protein [Nonomuraea turkmeniaca]TMR15668.1 two pore domain potassium channel family protein [Nonomuraea turkmeniaca]